MNPGEKRRSWNVFIQKNGLIRDVWNEDRRPGEVEVKVTEIIPDECVISKSLIEETIRELSQWTEHAGIGGRMKRLVNKWKAELGDQ